MADLRKLYDAVLNGDQKASVAITREALAAGASPMELIAKYMVPAIDEVGNRFECDDLELLLSARAMRGSLDLLRPLLAASGNRPAGRVVIGTVKGDLHDIGKNLVASMLEGGGFEVLDLGASVPPEKMIEAVKVNQANIVCLSALLTVTMPTMRNVIDGLKRAGVRDQVKVIVGGAPVTAQFAEEIGADGYGTNASSAVALARKLIGVPDGLSLVSR